MNEPIVIEMRLDLSKSAREAKDKLTEALNSPDAQTKAREAGRKIGGALGLGIETGRDRQAAERKELAHQRRIEAITLQSANRLQQIEARKQAQLDSIRERGFQKELEHQRKIERETQRASNAFSSVRTALAGIAGVFAVLGASRAISFFENIARQAIDAAVAIDRQVNTLKALTGSAEAATRRFRELFDLAQRTPGLTTGLALTLDNQLRILNVTEQTINRLLPAIGRLNAIAPLGDPGRFAGNLTQLITQGFERQDLKELVGNSPFAGELIKQIFSVDSPTNAKAIRESARKLGINTVEEFFTEFAKAAENNPRLQAVSESLGTQFEKLQDRIQVALAPIGEELLKTILPVVKDLVKTLEQEGPKVTKILRDNRDEISAIASALVTMTGRVIQLADVLNRMAGNLGIIRLLSMLAATVAGGPGAAITLGRSFVEADAQRARVAARLPFGLSIDETLGGIRSPQSFRPRGGSVGGIATSGSRRAGGLDLPTLTADDLVSSQFEREDDFRIIQAARARGRETRARLTREAEQARQNLINEGRDTRRRLTAEADDRAISEFERVSRRGLTRSGRFIAAGVSRGALTGGEAELLDQASNREFANKLRELLALEKERGKLTEARKDDLEDEIELYDRLGTSISNSERFLRGFNSATQSVGDAFERFGQNVSNAFRNVRDLFNGLKQAVLGFFNDLVGTALQNLVRSTLGGLFGKLGGALGGGQGASGFPATVAQAFASGGGGISAPPPISLGPVGFGQGGASASTASTFGGVLPRSAPGFSDALLRGAGFGSGRPSFLGGLGRSLAAAAPAVGFSLGGSVGGQSGFGQVLGSAGGLLAGGAVAGFAGALGPTATAFFTNPFTIAIGAGLLIGGALLGKAKQRKQDEEASGQFLTQALQGIEQLAAGIMSGQVDGGQARSIFDTQILGTFKQQIGGLKTKSVRESRLTNQVRDLERVYQDRIPPLILQQQAQQLRLSENAARFSRQIPEFATGGIVPGIDMGRDSVVGLMRPGELVLTRSQQSSVIAQSNPNVFDRAGVPRGVTNVGGAQAFQAGGFAQAQSAPEVNVVVLIGKEDQTQVFVNGVNTSRGRAALAKNIDTLNTDRDI